MNNKMSPKRLSLRFDEDKKEVLKGMAERHNTTISDLVRKTLEKVIEYERKNQKTRIN